MRRPWRRFGCYTVLADTVVSLIAVATAWSLDDIVVAVVIPTLLADTAVSKVSVAASPGLADGLCHGGGSAPPRSFCYCIALLLAVTAML